VFTPVLAKHTKGFNLIDTLAVGVDRIQRSFEPMRRQVEEWRQAQITDERAKLILYSAFVDGELEAPRSLLSARDIRSPRHHSHPKQKNCRVKLGSRYP
jgi:hypothetical protein